MFSVSYLQKKKLLDRNKLSGYPTLSHKLTRLTELEAVPPRYDLSKLDDGNGIEIR